MSDQSELKKVLNALISLQQEIDDRKSWLWEQYPDIYDELDEMEALLSSLREMAKDLLRRVYPEGGKTDLAGHTFEVKKGRKKVQVDLEQLIQRAQERGEIGTLLETGVLRYDCNPGQVDRLEGALRAVYKSYIREESGTPSVYMPPYFR